MSVNEKSIYSWILYIEISYNMYIGKKILENLLCYLPRKCVMCNWCIDEYNETLPPKEKSFSKLKNKSNIRWRLQACIKST